MGESTFLGPLISIGTVRTSRTDALNTPVQSLLNFDETGVIEIKPEFLEGLDGLEGFDYVWLISLLTQGEQREPRMRVKPILLTHTTINMGVFATRGPRRVNPIGLSLVRFLGIDGATIRFSGVDLLDGTVIIDIKPYVALFDCPDGDVRCGWIDELAGVSGIAPEH